MNKKKKVSKNREKIKTKIIDEPAFDKNNDRLKS